MGCLDPLLSQRAAAAAAADARIRYLGHGRRARRRRNGVRVGQAVYGVAKMRFMDGETEYAICVAGMMAAKPASLSDVEAASVSVIAATVQQTLFDHARLIGEQGLVVHGAAGNIGRFAVQLAAAAGLRVDATAVEVDAEAVRALGADVIIGRDLRSGERFDAAVDLVGGQGQIEIVGLIHGRAPQRGDCRRLGEAADHFVEFQHQIP